MTTARRRGTGATVAGFCYHDVTDDPRDSGFQGKAAIPFKLRLDQFALHLDGIARGLATPALVNQIELSRPGRHLLLTFDDGGKSALRVGEELSRRGWRGHFFVSTRLIGQRTFLHPGEIRHLRECGHIVGSHSHTHPNIYRELEWERMVVEWRQSSDILAQILGEPCITASVPGGEISQAVLRSADRAGLRYLFTSEPWLRPRIVGGCWILGRFCAKANTSPQNIAELATFGGWTSKLLARRIKAVARRCIPPLYRLYVSRARRDWPELAR
jgi:peptidoglycan/xylan/chitin deacetylase (PgdA/CDA1 family)